MDDRNIINKLEEVISLLKDKSTGKISSIRFTGTCTVEFYDRDDKIIHTTYSGHNIPISQVEIYGYENRITLILEDGYRETKEFTKFVNHLMINRKFKLCTPWAISNDWEMTR